MKTLLRLAIFTTLVMTALIVRAQQPGTEVTYHIASSNCGATGVTFDHFYPLVNCHLNVTMNGNALGASWIYTSWGGVIPSQYGWAGWQGVGDLSPNYQNNNLASAWWSVDTSTFNFNALPGFPTGPIVCNGNCSTLTAGFVGVDDDGATYTADLVANAYMYKGCSSGRGGGCRMIMLVTDGTLRVNYF